MKVNKKPKEKRPKAPKTATPEKLLVADQKKITVYFPPDDLKLFKKAVVLHNEGNVVQVTCARVEYILANLWINDPALQERVRKEYFK